uniref:Nucleolar protein 12 n=1 Tax=Gadus morhua TaxID=8049 RepID=A0A8C5FRW6_GADMO
MKNKKKTNNTPHKAKFNVLLRVSRGVNSLLIPRCREYLTGFHKRKVERRKAAVVEIQKKIKEEHIRVREERHKEYIRLLKERTDALESEDDDLEEGVTDTTESVQYDHPNHTVTVTTISNLDLTDAKLLGLDDTEVEIQDVGSADPVELILSRSKMAAVERRMELILSSSRKAGIERLTFICSSRWKGARGRKTSKKQRRQQTGKKQHYKD